MQRRQQRKLKSDGILSNLEPLLLVIREELGLDWCFYKEFLNCVRTATLKGEDTSVWVHHIEPLVQKPTLQFAHQGVLFLFREMGAALRSKSPPCTNMVSPSPLPSGQPPLPASPTSDVQRNFTGGHAPIASPPSAVNTRPPPSSSPANQLQRYRALDQAPVASLCFDRRGPPASSPTSISRPPAPPMASFSFDYSKPLKQLPVSANFSLPSADSVAFSGEKRRITVEPLKSAYSGGFVLHQDPAFRQDVQEFFGHKYPVGKSETKYYSQKDVPPVYKAADDDLAVWRADGAAGNVGNDSGGEGCVEDGMKSLEDRSRENLLERLRYKLFNE
ncbi:unnamed protein product [Alternaria alternata]